MQKFGIPHPCNEDFSKMTITERGAFCEKCSVDTYSFYQKSIPEIKSILRDNIGQEICGRFAPGQIEAINAEFEAWTFRSKRSFQSAFAMTLLVVFGLGLFSCQDQKQEAEIIDFQKTTKAIVATFENSVSLESAGNELLKETEKFQFTFDPALYPFNFGLINSCWNMMPAGAVYLPEYMNGWINQPQLNFPVVEDSVTVVDSVKIEQPADSVSVIETEQSFSVLAFPNPTSGITTIEYTNLEKGRYKIDLLDLNGKQLLEAYSGKIDEEIFRQEINLADFPSGTYIVVISSRKFKETTRIIKN